MKFHFQSHLNAVKFVSSGIPIQTLADIAANDVDASRVRVAVVSIQPAGLLAFVYI